MSEPAPESPLDRHRFRLLALICVGAALVSLTLLVAQQGWGALGRVSLVAGSAQIVGKWLIFVGVKADNPYGFGPWGISITIFVLDLLIALLLNSCLPQLERIPYFGNWLAKTRVKAGDAYSQYPKLRRMAWTGVMLWVFLPLPASGAVTGSFASRLVGLSRTSAVAAIAVGSIGNGVIFAAMAQWLGAEGEKLVNNWKVTTLSALVLLLLLWWGWRRLVKMLREEG
jgi:uncharacterized membrane protein